MCGFGGIINSKNQIAEADIKNIASKVTFRGPDSCGVAVMDEKFTPSKEGVNAIFFNRLAIVDLDARSDQPFGNGRCMLAFNGEIYNYKDLRTELEGKGIVFKTTSDTEVLFYALQQWGTGGLKKLNGMFSFCWIDKVERRIILARDRLGIKPLYYSLAENTLCFASELDSIVSLTGRPYQISSQAVSSYLWMQSVPTPLTILEGINKLPPGSYLDCNIENINAQCSPRFYWDAYEAVLSAQPSKKEQLEQVLKNSIELQLQADVPLGLFLSSGVDSSLLAAIVNKFFSKEEVNFYTIAFEEQTASDESQDAEEYINGFKNPNLKIHRLGINPETINKKLNSLYDFYDEPFGDPASLLNWAISEKAREHVTVALSGDGADELFWGYPRYNKWQEISKFNRSPFISASANVASHLLPTFEARTKMQRAFRSDAVERHFDQFLLPGFRPYLTEKISTLPIWAMKSAEKIKGREDLPAVLDIKTYLADAMLYKVDRSSMASSLEVRVPYLDNAMIDFAFGLPFAEKSNNKFKNKAVLKELLIRLAPHYDATRAKKGFNFPLKKWLMESWKEQICDMVTPSFLTTLGLEAKIQAVVTDLYSSKKDTSVEVWYLFNLALWKQKFDRQKTASGA